MKYSIPLRELYQGKSLIADCWEGSRSFKSLVPRHFLDPGSFALQTELLDKAGYPRQVVAGVLREQNAGYSAGERTLLNIEKLSDPSSVVVIGGQQAGLFGGPLYTLYKALTVLAVAEHLAAALGRPVVPLFWIASEDHDLAEVNHASILDETGMLRRISLGGRVADRVPVSRVPLEAGVLEALSAVSSALGAQGMAREPMEALVRSYAPASTYPKAFGTWMQYCLRERGIVMVDPSDLHLKRIAAPLFRREILEKGPVGRAVIRQTVRLEAAGYSPQIELRDGMLTLFHQDPAREAIVVEGNDFIVKNGGKRFSTDRLLSLLEESPQAFSPNAALRPLFQDSLFPTAAVVLGPSEIAYYTQLAEAYVEMGIPMPVLFPRASFTIVDAGIGKLLDRHGIAFREVIGRGERILDDLVRREIPPSLLEHLGESRRGVAHIWDGFIEEVGRFEPTLRQTAKNAAGFSAKRFEHLEKKIVKAARRKDETLRRLVERIVSSLYPANGLQERTLCILPFLFRHGKAAIDAVAAELDPFAPEHRGVRIDP